MNATPQFDGGKTWFPHAGGARVLLKATDLCKAYGGTVVLKSVSLELREGDVVLLQGDNGAGKSTLIDILSGYLLPDSGSLQLATADCELTFAFPQTRWNSAAKFALSKVGSFLKIEKTPVPFRPEYIAAKGVARTWQHMRLFPEHTLRENLVLAARSKGENPLNVLFKNRAVREEDQQLTRVADALLQRLNLSKYRDSYSDSVSLGEAKRVAILRAVYAGSKLLLLDEPLAGLDAKGVEGVLSLLTEIRSTHRTTLIIVEHVSNMAPLTGLVQTVWTLASGSLHAKSVDQLIKDTQDRSTDTYVMAKEWAGGEPYARREFGNGAFLSLFSKTRKANNCILHLNRCSVQRKKATVLKDISIELQEGDLAIIEAPNGWGKTTLAEAVAGLLPIESGSIRLDDNEIGSVAAWKRARSGLLFLPARNNTFNSLTVSESFRLAGAVDTPVPLRHLAERLVGSLSGGEKQKLAISCFNSVPARVRILDEPFSGLDKSGIEELWTRILPGSNSATLLLFPGKMKRRTI
jgi:ABC-type branched-subunit amino acid transport system ATPase component